MKKVLIILFLIDIIAPVFSQTKAAKPFKILEGHTYKINYLRFSNDSRYLVSAGWDNYTILWDMKSFSKIRDLKEHKDWIREVSISPDNRYIVSASHDGSFKIWDLKTGELKHDVEISPKEFIKKGSYPEFDRKTKNAVCAVTFSQDGKYLAVGTLDEFIRIWNLDQFKLIKKLRAHGNGTGYIIFSNDGNIMVSGSIYNELIVWDAKTFNPLDTLNEYWGYNSSFELFNNDRQLVNTGNDTINIWDISGGKLLRSIPVQDMLQSVQLTPDEKYMVTCGEDHSLKLWDFKTGKELWSYYNPKPELADCKISPDGRLLALATPEGKILIWLIKDIVKSIK